MTDDEPAQPEAVRYRKRLRDAEAQRDGLAARVAALQRAQVEMLLARENIAAEALWAVTDIDALLDAEGLPDPVKVTEAARHAREVLGLPSGLYVPAEGRLPSTAPRRFTDAFTPNRKEH